MSDGIKRRDFLKVLGVSGAGAGMVGCSTDEVARLIPYVVPPEDVTPGVATWYTSVCQECSAQCGIWVRTREGRAVKVEGNPNHPTSLGSSCIRSQASLQGLYNPDRFTGPMARVDGELQPIGWDEAEQRLAQALQQAGQRTLFINGRVGPSLSDLTENFISALGGRRVEHEGLSLAPLREAARIAFGSNVVPRFDFSQARFVVSFGADFLETWLSPVEYMRGFSRASSVTGEVKAPFVFVGPRLNLTGQNADEWVPVEPGAEMAVALGMAHVIAGSGGGSAGPYGALLQEYTPEAAGAAAGVEPQVIVELAERFVADGPSLAVGPGVAEHHRNVTASHLAVLILNQVAGNVGRTVLLQGGSPAAASAPYGELEDAIRAMAAGEVQVALIHDTNPAYTLPPTSGFAEALANVPLKVSFAPEPDETTALADLVLPDRHWLEAWGDSNPRPGVYALQQPVMQPIERFDSKQTGDVLISLGARLGQDFGAASFYDYLRTRWGQLHGTSGGALGMPATEAAGAAAGADVTGEPSDTVAAAVVAGGQTRTVADFDAWWREVLRRGVVEVPVEGAGAPAATLRSPDLALSFDVPELDPVPEGAEGEGFILIVYPGARFGDGSSLANSPWLLELPDPVSKITWHSWVEIHPIAAEELGVEDGDIVTVASPHGEVALPVWVYPGIRPDAVGIQMGLGHENSGRWANDQGVNPMRLLPAVAEQPSGALVTLATRVVVRPTGTEMKLATIAGADTQHDRHIAQALSFAAWRSQPSPINPDPAADALREQTALEQTDEDTGIGEEEHAEEGYAAGAGEYAGDDGHGPLKELQLGGGFAPVETEGDPDDFPLPGTRRGDYVDWEVTPRWAMAIDLDKCTGCSACVIACQAENNVPYVGQQNVTMGRDMHWIRLERYYESVDATHAGPVDVRHLPMLCQHCGNAPCEPVCPVYAAYHTPDGMNGQVYNRCVGTRYCANNCPYKVRVFNWYTFTGDEQYPEPLNWQFNPDVTVRENGVMEKCSFCVQRVREAQNQARLEERAIAADEVQVACAQACPAEAIVFGNIRDEDSRVARAVHDEPRMYRVLDDLINTQPAVSYLKKVTFHDVASGAH